MSALALQHFFAMGGYAAYVWPAYAVFFAVLLADTLSPALRRRRVLRDLRAQLVRQAARQARHANAAAPSSSTNETSPRPA